MKIAILKGYDLEYDSDYNSYSRRVAESITDWAEVTQEEYQSLQYYLKQVDPKLTMIIERIPNERIPQLVQDCLKKAKQVELERQRYQAELEKRKAAQKAKKMEKERLKFLALKEKYENLS